MSVLPLEERVTLLETELTDLKRHLSTMVVSAHPWWEQILGTFADTPAFDQAARLGREYRQAQREALPKAQDDDVSS